MTKANLNFLSGCQQYIKLDLDYGVEFSRGLIFGSVGRNEES